jgi:hypothetical protein
MNMGTPQLCRHNGWITIIDGSVTSEKLLQVLPIVASPKLNSMTHFMECRMDFLRYLKEFHNDNCDFNKETHES